MASIKIADLNAVRELSAQELSVTKGGSIYLYDLDVVDNKCGTITGVGGDVTATGIGATFSKSFNDAFNHNLLIL